MVRTPLRSVSARVGGTCGALRGEPGIDGIDIEVLVPGGVLGVEQILRVAAPEILPHRTGALGAHRTGGAERFARLLDPDVPGSPVRLEEGDVLSIRRDLRTADCDLAEEHAPGDDCDALRHF
jgi:hypothetical protein